MVSTYDKSSIYGKFMVKKHPPNSTWTLRGSPAGEFLPVHRGMTRVVIRSHQVAWGPSWISSCDYDDPPGSMTSHFYISHWIFESGNIMWNTLNSPSNPSKIPSTYPMIPLKAIKSDQSNTRRTPIFPPFGCPPVRAHRWHRLHPMWIWPDRSVWTPHGSGRPPTYGGIPWV